MIDSSHPNSTSAADGSTHDIPQPGRDHGPSGALVRDPLVRIVLVVFGLVALPYVIPIMSDEWMSSYGDLFVDLPFLALVIVTMRFHLRSTTNLAGRRFWSLMSFAPVFWLGFGIMNLAFSKSTEWEARRFLLIDLSFLVFYGAIVVALETCPHLPPEGMNRRLKALNRAGTFIFLVGSLLYFTVLPGLVDADAYGTSTLVLFVVLDAYIISRLAGLLSTSKETAWYPVYAWLLLASAMWFVSDAAFALVWQGFLPFVDSGTLWDLVWPLSFIAVVVAARCKAHQRDTSHLHAPIRERLGMGPLVVYAVAAPLVHLTAYRLGWAEPDLRPFREVLVVLSACVFAGMAMVYQGLLRRENRRLAEEGSLAQERLAHQAYHDDLTDLPNRILFCDHLRLAIARARRYQTRCAILHLDLDQFKVINDSLGHEAGDEILVVLADRLRNKIREVDTVARFGGDEFSVLVQDIHEVVDAAKLAEILLASLSDPVVVAGQELVLTTSVGIAIYPDDGNDDATLLKHADIAMYQAKQRGRNAYQLFTTAMNDAARERLAVERGFREALSNGHLEVHYQPIIDLMSRQPIGCEALLRWNHPTKGLIGPASFIGVAEQTGLIVPAGEWVLEVACTWAQQLESTVAKDLSIAVNLSPRQLQESSFAAKVAAILDRTGLDPTRLQLEITESMALDADSTVKVLSGLRDQGVRIAIDDLGTGFSGLSRLRDLPMDVIKIDRSFIKKIHADPVGEAIVRGVVGIAKALDLYVVAEGVETQEQLDVIERLRCHAVQGFLLHRPVPPEDLIELLAHLKPPPIPPSEIS